MLKLIKIIRNISAQNYVFLFFFFLMIFILFPANLWIGSDDTVYLEQIGNMGMFSWIWWRATSWQPRLVSDFLFAVFNGNLILWKLFVAIVSTIILFFICKLADRNKINRNHSMIIYIIVCSSFFLIPPRTFSEAISWYTGSFHYFWPTAFFIFAIIPFYCALAKIKIEYKFTIYISIVGAIFTGYHEQCTAIFVCFSLITFLVLLFRKEKIKNFLLTEFILVIINLTIYVCLGGNSIRSSSELYWYRNFPMLSIVDKIFQGVNWGNYILFHSSEILMSILTFLIFILSIKTNKNTFIRFISAAVFLSFFVGLLPIDSVFSNFCTLSYGENYKLNIPNIISGIFNSMNSTPGNFELNWSSLFPSFFCLFIVMLVGGLIFYVCNDIWISFANMILYFASLLSAYVLGFSPTIFASGHRIFFVTDVLLILLIALLIYEIESNTDFFYKKYSKIFAGTILMLSLFFVLENVHNNFIGVIMQ